MDKSTVTDLKSELGPIAFQCCLENDMFDVELEENSSKLGADVSLLVMSNKLGIAVSASGNSRDCYF